MSVVIFRRIHGRIVPIRSETKHNVAEGSALVGAGVGTAYVSGQKAASLTHESAIIENSARAMHAERQKIMAKAVSRGPLFVHGAKQATENLRHYAETNEKISHVMRERAFRVRTIGAVAAATLVGAGVHRATKGTRLEKNPKAQAAIATGAGAAAGFAAYSGFARGVGNRGFKVLKLAARRAFLKL